MWSPSPCIKPSPTATSAPPKAASRQMWFGISQAIAPSPVTNHGWSQIRDDFMSKLRPLSGDTFLRAELLDVAIGEHFVVAVQHATASHRGKELDITACQLMTVRDGLIHEVRGYYSDQKALDAFWQ